jgi:hypothetical protein
MRNTWIGLGFAALVATAGPGCAKRLPLTPVELEKVKTEAGIQPLRVYASKKVFALSAFEQKNQEYTVQKVIVESERSAADKYLITRNDSGLILKIGEQNGANALWVTFDPRYPKPEDALVFVQTEDGKYRLHSVAKRPGFTEPTTYVTWVKPRRRMKLGKMRSLAEANDVLLVKKKSGKLLTIELQVKKIIDTRTRTRTRRAGGVD